MRISVKKVRNKIYKSYLKNIKKIFILCTAEHDNIGDSAIAQSMINFAKKYYKDYKIVEISISEYFLKRDFLFSILNNKDIIWIAGGGNLGNVYLDEEKVRRDIIANVRNNPIVIFPQSVYFTEDEIGQKEADISSKIYENNPKLILFLRDPISFEIASNIFPNTKKYLVPDIVCSYSYKNNFKRDGILCCIRDLNDESGLDRDKYNSIFQIIQKQNEKVNYTKNIYKKNVTKDIRKKVVQSELDFYAQHKLVVTDRLHGLIFAIVTKTPCIVFKSQNHKITGFVDFLKDSNCVKYMDTDVELLDSTIKNFLNLKNIELPDWNIYLKEIEKYIKDVSYDE